MDDLISRAGVMEALDHERKVLIEQKRYGAEHIVVHHARRMIEELPAVDAIPVEWLRERKHWAAIDGDHWAENIIRYLLDAWQKEQEVR